VHRGTLEQQQPEDDPTRELTIDRAGMSPAISKLAQGLPVSARESSRMAIVTTDTRPATLRIRSRLPAASIV
jgi:hypothetical protein